MNIEDGYIKFLTKVNRNLKSNNVTASKDRFILLYNEEQIRRVDFILENKNNDELREIEPFLGNANLTSLSTKGEIISASLPSDYLDLSSASCLVDSGKCVGERVSLNEIKDFDKEQVVTNENEKPSFEYREAPYYIGGGNINIFFDNFTVTEVILSYYKYPKPVDISGYIKTDGSASSDIDPEGSERFINKVINMCAESFARNYNDTNSITINKDRIVTNT